MTNVEFHAHDVEAAICQHAALFDIPTQAVMATTLDGSVVYWSDTATRIYGWRREEVLGRDILEITPSALTREQAATIMKRLQAGEIWSGEFDVQSRDGETFRAQVSDVPVRNSSGDLIGIIGISHRL